MQLLFDVFVVVTLPLIALIGVGYVVQAQVPEATRALNFIHANVVLPAFMVHFISTSSVSLAGMWPVIAFTIVQSLLLGGFAWLLARQLGFVSDTRPVVAISGTFANTGNFGVPLAVLAYPAEYTVPQAIIAATTLVMFAVLGPPLLAPLDEHRSGMVRSTLRAMTNPIVLSVIAGCAMKALDLHVPQFLSKPVQMLSDSYTTVALMGLGAALGGRVARFGSRELVATVVMKVLLAPLLTVGLAYAAGFRGIMLTLLVVASSMPTAVLVGVIAAQNRRSPEIATGAVFTSTVLAPFVVTLWVVVMREIAG
jgi:predicted permease